jgi:hypothetical protein
LALISATLSLDLAEAALSALSFLAFVFFDFDDFAVSANAIVANN